jgi:hypothetical protein
MIRAKRERSAGSKTLALGLLAAVMAVSLILTARPAHADTFTVTNALDSGGGSLRQAIIDANNNQGADTINFNIPVQAVHTISPLSELPAITDPLTIDGYSQPGSEPNTRATGAIDSIILIELNGTNAGGADGLDIQASNVVVRGLAINRFANNGIRVNSDTGARIEGNFIGMDPSGTLDRGNVDDGVDIEGNGTKHTIGGILPGQRNLISGNNGVGVEVGGDGSTKVQGNLMGVQRNGSTSIVGSERGVNILSPRNTVGGTEPGAANTIAFNREAGVQLNNFDSTVGNRILSNSIFSNVGPGIDLGGDGRTLNDPRDPDKGPNTLQNFPVLTSIETPEEGRIFIEGTLDSSPSTRDKKRSFTIQFFANPSTDPDEGRTFLGQKKAHRPDNRDGHRSRGQHLRVLRPPEPHQ